MIDLKIVKMHLNIDESFVEDDDLIRLYVHDAFAQLVEDTGCVESELKKDGELTPLARRAVLLLVGDFYAYRENTYNGSITTVPEGYKRYVNLLRHYE